MVVMAGGRFFHGVRAVLVGGVTATIMSRAGGSGRGVFCQEGLPATIAAKVKLPAVAFG